MTPQPTLTPLEVTRADVTLQANFASEFWPLFHNIPAFYAALLQRLRDEGLTPTGIRADVGDGSLGGYQVSFWLLDIRAFVKIRLQHVEIEFRRMLASDVEPLHRIFVGVLEALKTAMLELQFATYAADIQLHGETTGVAPKDFAARFVTNVPTALGPVLGSGTVFYFGPPLSSITVDMSGLLPGKLYVRLSSIIEGTNRPEDVKPILEKHLSEALAAIGLLRETTEGL